jgi:hypothetical protein
MENSLTAWERFAEANDLVFLPGRFLQQKAQVVGLYRGYHLQLSYWTFGVEIILSTGKDSLQVIDNTLVEQPISPEMMNDFLFEPHLLGKLGGYFRAADLGQKFYYHTIGDKDFRKLSAKKMGRQIQSLTGLADDYRRLLAYGGEAVPALIKKLANQTKLSDLALRLLHDIEDDTTDRLAADKDRMYCRWCFFCCGPHPIIVPRLWGRVELQYYGCRRCGQSRQLYNGPLIAVLDRGMAAEQLEDQNALRLNWLVRRALFDFDEVIITQATDEEVERFVVQVGNDTDVLRKSRYQKMVCTIVAGCDLSANTLKLLKRMFGTVEYSVK